MADMTLPTTDIIYKTIDQCEVVLVAHSHDAVHDDGNLDRMPARAARVSFDNDLQEHSCERDIKLIRYLADHQHMTPFEHQSATVMIECPLFIRSQIHRHRTFSYSELSRRYTSDGIEFWLPGTLRQQADSNRQASVDQPIQHNEVGRDVMRRLTERAVGDYLRLLDMGVCREQARAVLPQNLLTRFYMTGNLRNWAHFLELRMDRSHAQYENYAIALRIYNILRSMWPLAIDALVPPTT